MHRPLLFLAAIDAAAEAGLALALGAAATVAAFRQRRPTRGSRRTNTFRNVIRDLARLTFLLARLRWARWRLAAARLRHRLTHDPAVQALAFTLSEIAAGVGFVLFVIAAAGWAAVLGGH